MNNKLPAYRLAFDANIAPLNQMHMDAAWWHSIGIRLTTGTAELQLRPVGFTAAADWIPTYTWDSAGLGSRAQGWKWPPGEHEARIVRTGDAEGWHSAATGGVL